MKLGEDTEPDATGDRLRARTKNILELIPEVPVEGFHFPQLGCALSTNNNGWIPPRFSKYKHTILGETTIFRRGETQQDDKRGKCWECVKCGTGEGQGEREWATANHGSLPRIPRSQRPLQPRELCHSSEVEFWTSGFGRDNAPPIRKLGSLLPLAGHP